MASKSDICNRALAKLGQPRVSNVDTDNTENAKIMRYMYDIVRDALLAEYPWNFALKRAQLAKHATAPAWGFNNAYTLPSDFLSLVEIKNNPDYRVENDADGDLAILTDEGSPIYILYIRRIEDAGIFKSLFVEAFATRLAFEACESITESNTKKQILGQEYEMSIKKAFASDAIQDPPQTLQESAWITSRDARTDEIDYNA